MPYTFDNTRSYRQELFKKIEDARKSKCILIGHFGNAQLTDWEADVMQDIVSKMAKPSCIDIIIHSPGGLIEPAIRIIDMIRGKFPDTQLNAIVPYMAYSAATVLVLGCNKIHMDYGARLGPVDAQYTIGEEQVSSLTIYDLIQEAESKVKAGTPFEVYLPLLEQINPLIYGEILRTRASTISITQRYLEKYSGAHLSKEQREDTCKKLCGEIAPKGAAITIHSHPITLLFANDELQLQIQPIPDNIYPYVFELIKYYRRTENLFGHLAEEGFTIIETMEFFHTELNPSIF